MVSHDYKGRLLHIAIPMHDGRLSGETMLSLVRYFEHIRSRGGRCAIDNPEGKGIVLARNVALSHAYYDKEVTDFLFVDGDISFSPEAVESLMFSGLDFAAGAYPYRGINWDQLFQRIQQGHIESPEDLAMFGSPFPIRLPLGALRVEKERFVEATHVPTGFLYISRAALDKLANASRRYHYRPGNGPEEIHHYFVQNTIYGDSPSDPGEFVGEDFFLCDKWREKCGGKIYVDAVTRLEHSGKMRFCNYSIADMAAQGKLG